MARVENDQLALLVLILETAVDQTPQDPMRALSVLGVNRQKQAFGISRQ